LDDGPDNTRLRGLPAIDFDLARENQRSRFTVEITEFALIFRMFRAVLGERGAESLGVLFRITPGETHAFFSFLTSASGAHTEHTGFFCGRAD